MGRTLRDSSRISCFPVATSASTISPPKPAYNLVSCRVLEGYEIRRLPPEPPAMAILTIFYVVFLLESVFRESSSQVGGLDDVLM